MAYRHLYLIRHGHYNRQDRTEFGGGLTDLGVSQVRLTAQMLSSLCISAVHSSVLRRAVETAEIIVAGLPKPEFQKSRDLCEVTLTSLLSEPELIGRDLAQKAFDRYFRPNCRDEDEQELLVCHGNLIRYFVCLVLETEPESLLSMVTFHCGVSQFRVHSNGKVDLVSYNDVGHLPYDIRTED